MRMSSTPTGDLVLVLRRGGWLSLQCVSKSLSSAPPAAFLLVPDTGKVAVEACIIIEDKKRVRGLVAAVAR